MERRQKYKNSPCYVNLNTELVTSISDTLSAEPSNSLKFDSKFEARVYLVLRKLVMSLNSASVTTELLVKPVKEIWINQIRVCTYTPDFQVRFSNGLGNQLGLITVEAKGYLTELAALKYRLAIAAGTIAHNQFFLVSDNPAKKKIKSPRFLTLKELVVVITDQFNQLKGEN